MEGGEEWVGEDEEKVGLGRIGREWRGGAYSQEAERDGADEFANGGCCARHLA